MKAQGGFMAREIDAIYENGVLRPLEPLDLEEQQRVRITIDDGDPLADLLDTEFMEWCARKAAGDVPSIEEVRQMLSKIKGSMADVVIAERDFVPLLRRFLRDVAQRQFQVLRVTNTHYEAAVEVIEKYFQRRLRTL